MLDQHVGRPLHRGQVVRSVPANQQAKVRQQAIKLRTRQRYRELVGNLHQPVAQFRVHERVTAATS